MPTRKDMEPGEVRKHEEMVAAVKTYIREHINPFTVESLNLINISSGVVASGDVARHLSSAMQTGETQYRKFVEDRLVKKEQSVFATLKSLKLKTFAENTVKSSSESSEKRTTLIATNKLLSRLLTISQREQVDLKDVVRYALAEIPPALGNGDGSMTKTNKSAMMHEIMKDAPQMQVDHAPTPLAVVIDGMAFLRQLRNLPSTFCDLAAHVLDAVVGKAVSAGAQRVDVVWDTYPEKTIKSAEQDRRAAAAGIQVLHLGDRIQKVPRNFQQYLASRKNKQALIDFLLSQWKEYSSAAFKGVLVYYASNTSCCLLNVGA
nr:hypothetical protein BaRGS_027788 [Batillaria attramentaria]